MSKIKLLESAPAKFQKVGDIRFAYCEAGDSSGAPVIVQHHLATMLDNFDPRIVGGLASISTGEPS